MLDTIGSIATNIASSFVLPAGISGNLVESVDMNRIYVQNYVRNDIGSNSIPEQYQNAILNLSKAVTLETAFAWASTYGLNNMTSFSVSGASNVDKVSIGDLTVDTTGGTEIAAFTAINSYSKEAPIQFRQMALDDLKSIGRKAQVSRVLS